MVIDTSRVVFRSKPRLYKQHKARLHCDFFHSHKPQLLSFHNLKKRLSIISSLFAFQIRRQSTSSTEGDLHWERLRGIISTKATYAPMTHGEGTEAGGGKQEISDAKLCAL